jgi:metal-responsive CopG/Arc/MetJ family transcriptional regulator
MKTLSITIEEPLLKELDQGMKRVGLKGRSEAVRAAIRDWVKKQGLNRKIRQEIQGYKEHPIQPDEFDPLIPFQELP